HARLDAAEGLHHVAFDRKHALANERRETGSMLRAQRIEHRARQDLLGEALFGALAVLRTHEQGEPPDVGKAREHERKPDLAQETGSTHHDEMSAGEQARELERRQCGLALDVPGRTVEARGVRAMDLTRGYRSTFGVHDVEGE